MDIIKINEFITSSPTETEKVAYDFVVKHFTPSSDNSNIISEPRFIAMYGDLGVGKTAFVRGMARALTPDADVNSPTYKLVNVYHPDSSHKPKLCHFDMYRISDEDDLYSIGFYDYIENGSIIVVEWSEKIEFALPDDYFCITISKLTYDDLSPDKDKRNILIQRIQKK